MKSQTLFIIAFLAMFVSACGMAYKAAQQRKNDDKLFAKAISNERVQDRVGNYWNAIHPITQKPTLIPGKDSVIYIHDSISVDKTHDSLIHVACPFLNLDSLRKANTKIIKEFHIQIDTLKVPDTSCSRSLNSVQINLSNTQGKNEVLTDQLNQAKKSGNKWMWLFIAACIVIAIENLLLLYNFLRPKIKV
ncbi:MAG: hypothetical protein ABI237_05910 [Ginsengibacter sp.]